MSELCKVCGVHVEEYVQASLDLAKEIKRRVMEMPPRNYLSYRPLDICIGETTYVPKNRLEIEKVVFNYPATIVLWKDGTKTVVKCQDGDEYSREHGLAMCIAKKAFGNKGKYNDVFRKWCE